MKRTILLLTIISCIGCNYKYYQKYPKHNNYSNTAMNIFCRQTRLSDSLSWAQDGKIETNNNYAVK
jgi:hypothetical protein